MLRLLQSGNQSGTAASVTVAAAMGLALLALASPFVQAALERDPESAASPAATSTSAATTTSDELPLVEATSLELLRAKPAHALGQHVTFVVQFHETNESWNPFLSRFGPANWIAVTSWADEGFTWNEDVYENPHRHLFVRRGSWAAQTALTTDPFSRLLVTGIVREVFGDEPWIEVLALERLDEEVGEGTILHVGRARDLLTQGQFDLALAQFQRAKAAPLPAHARAEIDRLIDQAEQAREEINELRKTVR